MKYSSVVVTYNRKEKLLKAINSIIHQTLRPKHIYLIDNHSTDGTYELLKDNGFIDNPLIKYFRLSKNIGGSGGFYYGIKKALLDKNIDYLSISDDDAVFKSNYFSLINQARINNPQIKAFCGTVKNANNVIQTDHRRIITNSKWIKEVEVPTEQYSDNFLVDTFSFVGCVISTDIIRKIGLPNKEYFIYYDDTEYSLRVREQTKILNVSNAIIHHLVKPPHNQKFSLSWKNYYQARNSTLMVKKHSTWKLVTLYLIYNQLRLDWYILTNPRFKGIRKRALKVYNDGFNDGIRNITGKNSSYQPGRNMLK